MVSEVTLSNKFEQDLDELFYFCYRKGYNIEAVEHIKDDIFQTIEKIKTNPFPNKLLGALSDRSYPSYKFFLTKKYNFKIFIKLYPKENMIKAVCLVGEHQLFKPEMFVEQLRQAFKEFNCDYDEANREYLAEQARLASMSDEDIAIEDICLR